MFEQKTVIVTGAASGIGLATAASFFEQGANVVVVDLREDAAKKAAGSLKGGGRAIGVKCDVSVERDAAAAVQRALSEFGALDIIVNNAGLMVFKPIEEQTEDDFLRVLRVDLLGAFFFIREGFRVMKAGSAIVNVSSIHAIETTSLVSSYAAAKAALVSLTHSAAIEGKAKGIRVNAVLPGAVDTPMLWNNPNVKAGLEKIGKTDLGKPEDIAAAITFLASSTAEFIQGAMLVVDGGRTAAL